MYKITKEMLEEFQRVMSIRPQLYHDSLFSKYLLLAAEDAEYYKDDANNDAANCLLLSLAAEIICFGQNFVEPKIIFSLLDLDFGAVQNLTESVAIYKGRGKEKTLDWELAVQRNCGNFKSYLGIYNEENAPKIEAQAVLYTIEWYLQEAGLYEMQKWDNAEHEAGFMAQFKDFERI